MADLKSDDGLLELALFAGAGGGILGGKLLGWRTVCAVEINAYAASVLVARQNDGTLDGFPIWSDIRSFGPRNPGCREMFAALREVRDRLVISGGFPCQDISVAGKGEGIGGERSGLWGEQARIIRKIQPRFAFVENSPALTRRGLYRVLGDMAEMGYDAQWGCISAEDVIWAQGSPCMDHQRERIWIVAERTNAKHDWVSIRRRIADSRAARLGTRRIQSDDAPSGEFKAIDCIATANANAGKQGSLRGVPRRPSAKPAEVYQGADATECGRVAFGGESDADNGATNSEWSSESVGVHSRDDTSSDAARIQQGRKEQRAERERTGASGEPNADTNQAQREGMQCTERERAEHADTSGTGWWQSEPDVGRVAHGVASRVDRLAAIGNGQVSAVAATAWRILSRQQ